MKWSRGFHRRSLVDERQLYQKSDKVVPLVFRFSPGLGSFLSPLPFSPSPPAPPGVRLHWSNQGNASENGRKGCEHKLPHTCVTKKHELKDEKLYRHRLVVHDPVHVAELRQRFGAHSLGQT